MCLRDIWMVPSEYIRDKNHVRMNATKWVTLSGFCKYLGSSGQCKIDETEKGNRYTWIDKGGFFQKVLMHLSFPQTYKPFVFLNLKI